MGGRLPRVPGTLANDERTMIHTSTLQDDSFIGGNYFDKYRSKNPIHRMLMSQFLSSARNMISEIDFESILEVGCGPGDLAEELFKSDANYLGIDIDDREIMTARARYPHRKFQHASAYELPIENVSIDLVVACEVLEHLSDPETAMRELDRVARKWILLSVPREPLWRILNFARGKYWRDLGNTPGHLQHFSRRDFLELIKSRWFVLKVKSPVPWTMALACKRPK